MFKTKKKSPRKKECKSGKKKEERMRSVFKFKINMKKKSPRKKRDSVRCG